MSNFFSHLGPYVIILRLKREKIECQYRQNEVLTRTEWVLAGTGNAGPTFNRHWVGVGLYSPPAVCTARPAAQQT